MTEKRADYRKKQQQKKIRKIFDNFNRLKKRLNYAILIVVVLLIVVLFALFKL